MKGRIDVCANTFVEHIREQNGEPFDSKMCVLVLFDTNSILVIYEFKIAPLISSGNFTFLFYGKLAS